MLVTAERELRIDSKPNQMGVSTETKTEQEIQVGEGVRFVRTKNGYQTVRLTEEEIHRGQAECLQNYLDLINRISPRLEIRITSYSIEGKKQEQSIFIKNGSPGVIAP